jgi:hypothetical protein
MIAATAFVLMMTIPGPALSYAGMVRRKNVLATMARSAEAPDWPKAHPWLRLTRAYGAAVVFVRTG